MLSYFHSTRIKKNKPIDDDKVLEKLESFKGQNSWDEVSQLWLWFLVNQGYHLNEEFLEDSKLILEKCFPKESSINKEAYDALLLCLFYKYLETVFLYYDSEKWKEHLQKTIQDNEEMLILGKLLFDSFKKNNRALVKRRC